MTMTLTDNDRETIRWFAEERLGLEYRGVDVGGNPYWHAMGESYRDIYDLLDWPGFGRVVEYALGRGLAVIPSFWPSAPSEVTISGAHGVLGMVEHADPAIAAMMALRQAVEEDGG